MTRGSVLMLLVAWTLGGCVTQGTYDALDKTLDETRKTLSQKEVRVIELEGRVVDLEDQIKLLEARLEKLNKEKSDILKDKSNLQASVEEMQAALQELEQRKAQVEQRLAEFRGLLDRFKPLMDSGKLRVKIVNGRMVVELASDVLFASGSAALEKTGRETIIEVAGLLASIPDRAFQVEGHTDNVPIRTERFPSNWELAAARALTVVKTMLEAGMPPERVSAASCGESRPARPNDTKENKAANRRIEIVVVPDLSTLPGYEELQKLSQ